MVDVIIVYEYRHPKILKKEKAFFGFSIASLVGNTKSIF